MTVPLVQGVLRYAHKRSGLSNEDQTSTLAEMHLGEGAAFAAAALPMVFKCSHELNGSDGDRCNAFWNRWDKTLRLQI